MSLNDKVDTYNIASSFSDNPKYDFGIYAKGYRKAAKLLSDKFLTQNGFADYEGYPIVFLYRHALELNLKNIIYWGIRLAEFKNQIPIDKELYNQHFLNKLAKKSTDILRILFKHDAELESVIKNMILVAEEYSELDINSFSYRYPIDITGSYPTKKNQLVNITSLTDCMEDLLDSIEAINFGLNIETDRVKELFEILSNFSDN